MPFFGALVRIFTTIEETGDDTLLVTYLSAATLESTVAGQVISYWNFAKHKAVTKHTSKIVYCMYKYLIWAR